MKVNLSKDWVVYSLVRRREHLEDRGPITLFLAGQAFELEVIEVRSSV
jgi:hypothetical protein